MQRSRSQKHLPKVAPYASAVHEPVHMPPSEGSNPALAIQDLKALGHTDAVARELVKLPGYLEAHQALFTKCPKPLAQDAQLGDLLEPLCAVCSAWLAYTYMREASALLEQLLLHHPHAPAAHELLRTHAAKLCGFVGHGAPGILAGIETCAHQYPLTPVEWQAFIELANHLHPLRGLKLELRHLLQRVKSPMSMESGEKDPQEHLLLLATRAGEFMQQAVQAPTELLDLLDHIAKAIDSLGQGGELNALRRVESLKRRYRHQLMEGLQRQMHPWFKLPTHRDPQTHQCSLELQTVGITMPKAWTAQDLRAALAHFHQWLAWQLEDPQGLPWATLKGLIKCVADALGASRWQPPTPLLLPLIQLSCKPALPLEVRAQLLETLIPWLPSAQIMLTSRPDKEHQTIQVEYLRALCGLSEVAPGHCAPLWDRYRQGSLLKESDALHQLIQLLMDLQSRPQPNQQAHSLQSHEVAVRWMKAYAQLNLRPDASASPPLWRVLCGFLLKHCIAAARQNPWSIELFLQALHRLSTPAVGRSPVLQAIPSQLRLLLDQVAGLATPAERLDWLRQLDRHCALQPPAEGVDPHQHLALCGAIRCLLKRQGDPVPTGSTAITFFEQWADYLLTHVDTLEARTVPQARARLDALELEHQTLCSLGPRFGGPLDRLVGQLMQVEFIRLQAAAAE